MYVSISGLASISYYIALHYHCIFLIFHHFTLKSRTSLCPSVLNGTDERVLFNKFDAVLIWPVRSWRT